MCSVQPSVSRSSILNPNSAEQSLSATLTITSSAVNSPSSLTVEGEAVQTDPDFAAVSLLLKGEATPFTDSSASSKSLSNTNNVTLDTSIKKFGAGSLKLTTSYLSAAASDDFHFTGDFTIEAWANFSSASAPTHPQIVSVSDGSGSNEIRLQLDGARRPVFYLFHTSGVAKVTLSGSTALNQNQWYHLAIVREGTRFALYVDGSEVASTSSSTVIPSKSWGVRVGYLHSGVNPGINYYFPGNLDEVRITKGVARYSSNFSAPTAAFPSR